MGGIGSGRKSDRPTTDNCVRLEFPLLRRLGLLERSCLVRRRLDWGHKGRKVARLFLETDIRCLEQTPRLAVKGHAFGLAIDDVVLLEGLPMPIGGERFYARCPMTGRRCTTLVLPPGEGRFASVAGWGVAYSSQREDKVLRAQRFIDRRRNQLARLSKYARKPTITRLRREIIDAEMYVDEELERLVAAAW